MTTGHRREAERLLAQFMAAPHDTAPAIATCALTHALLASLDAQQGSEVVPTEN